MDEGSPHDIVWRRHRGLTRCIVQCGVGLTGMLEMATLLHQTPEGEIVVHACESWPEGVESFWLVVDGRYGDSPENVWDVLEREDRGTLAAFGVAGDVGRADGHGLTIAPDGSFTVVPEGGDRWLLRG